jgi:DNA-binding transcriptional regulator YdaS (Cro superfamily)
MSLAIERATGGKVARHELRPDLYPVEPNTSVSGKPEAETAQATGIAHSQPLPNPEAAGQEAA